MSTSTYTYLGIDVVVNGDNDNGLKVLAAWPCSDSFRLIAGAECAGCDSSAADSAKAAAACARPKRIIRDPTTAQRSIVEKNIQFVYGNIQAR